MARTHTLLLLYVFSSYYLTSIVHSYGDDGYNPLEESFNAHVRRALHQRAAPEPEPASAPTPTPQEASADPDNGEIEFLDQKGLKERDLIESLPGQPRVNFKQYSGYVTIDSVAGRALFYYFVECTKTPWRKPLVLWLNGGPGCSSVGIGAFKELGPFRVKKDGKTLMRNKHSWNKKANILFLECPAGVGFSYSNRTKDYFSSGDKISRNDAIRFLMNWFDRFPEYKGRDFYLAGESYAGHYVPQLAITIVSINKEVPPSEMVMNLRGIAIGNALVDDAAHLVGATDFFYTHAFITKDLRDNITFNCNFTLPDFNLDNCISWRKKMGNAIRSINMYNLYAPICISPHDSQYYTDTDPCSDHYIRTYMNNREVQKAMHANTTGLPYTWTRWSNKISSLWSDREETVLPIIEELMASGIRIWIYSGDVDGCVPVTSTEYALRGLNLAVKTPWHGWQTGPKDIGGFVVEYHNLTFVTIRGSGHMVPADQPARALLVFSSFLDGKLPPPEDTPLIDSEQPPL